MRPAWLVLAALLGLAGCGARTLDATSEATAKASTRAMTAGMSEDQKRQFSVDMFTISIAEDMKAGPEAGPPKSPAEALKPLHGLTAAQIREKAEAARREMTRTR